MLVLAWLAARTHARALHPPPPSHVQQEEEQKFHHCHYRSMLAGWLDGMRTITLMLAGYGGAWTSYVLPVVFLVTM